MYILLFYITSKKKNLLEYNVTFKYLTNFNRIIYFQSIFAEVRFLKEKLLQTGVH